MKKNGMLLAALAIAAAILLGVWMYFRPATTEGSKDFHVSTNAEYLGEALQEAALIEGEEGPFGMYITVVDGVAADDSLQQWWCITKDGEQVNTGADTTPVADGDCFEITVMTGD